MGKKQYQNLQNYIHGNDYLISNDTNTPAKDLLTSSMINLLVHKYINNTPPFAIEGVIVTKVDIRCLYLDLGYQTLERHFTSPERLRKHWDSKRVGLLECNYRNGKIYVIDGGHRCEEALSRGIYDLPAQIHIDLPRSYEAEEFATQNEAKTPLKPIDTYNAWICSKDNGGKPTADSQIRDLAVKYGYTVTNKPKDAIRPLTAISAMRTIAKKPNGLSGLEWMFSLMVNSKWCIQPDFSNARYINAFYEVYCEGLNQKKLMKYTENMMNLLSVTSPAHVLSWGKLHYPNTDMRRYVKNTFLDIARGNIQKSDFVCMFADE